MLPNGEDDSDLMRLVKELQASDNERKSMLWKKLQSSYDGGNTDASNLKAPESAKPNIKGHEVKNPNLKPMVKEQSIAIKPPPPPPLPSKTTLGKRSVRRAPEVVELYRALTKRESHMGNKINQNGVLSHIRSGDVCEMDRRRTILRIVCVNLRKSKLYRFDKEANQWKERGAGTVKLLKHKSAGKIRLVMRQSKTLKICANHFVTQGISVQEHVGNEKSCVWHARDFADGELKDELFCIRFASIENCKAFMQKFNEVAESEVEKEESKEASDTAGLLEKLTVKETKTEEKPVEKEKTTVEADEKKKDEPEKAGEEKKTEEASPST